MARTGARLPRGKEGEIYGRVLTSKSLRSRNPRSREMGGVAAAGSGNSVTAERGVSRRSSVGVGEWPGG